VTGPREASRYCGRSVRG